MLRKLLLCAALGMHIAASASVVTAQYEPLGGADWTLSLTVRNDGTLPQIGGFTVYFPEGDFADLSLGAHPPAWDTIVVEPDTNLPAAGFLDAFAIDPLDALEIGQSAAGFEVTFSFHGLGTPSRLAYDIVDVDFTVLESGFTLQADAPSGIPEPVTWWLIAIALAVVSLQRQRWGLTSRRTKLVRPKSGRRVALNFG
jgi:hypothetical protein